MCVYCYTAYTYIYMHICNNYVCVALPEKTILQIPTFFDWMIFLLADKLKLGGTSPPSKQVISGRNRDQCCSSRRVSSDRK